MTALSITAANVVKGSGAVIENVTAGATITQAQPVYRDPATGTYKLADADSETAAVRQPRGLALNAASDGQPLQIIKSGPLTVGATMTAGVHYYLGAAPGAIVPVGDLGSGDYPCSLGLAISTTVLDVNIDYSGVEL